MDNPSDAFVPILYEYTRLTGRAAPIAIYDASLFPFVRAGFTADDMRTVVEHMLRENKRNHFQYGLKLSPLLNDLQRFNDLLEEAKAKNRNCRPAPTAKEKALNQLRPALGENLTSTGALTVKDILRKVVQQ